MAEGSTEKGQNPSASGGALGRLYHVLGLLGGIILAVMTAAVFLQVVLRVLGRVGIDGLEEVPRYLFIWLVMIGSAAAMYRGEHTVLDYFVNHMSPRLRSLIVIMVNAIGIGLFLYLIQLSFVLVPNAQLQSSPGLSLPLGYVFAAIPVGAVLIIVPMVRKILGELRSQWLKRS